jgi:ribonuclease PH
LAFRKLEAEGKITASPLSAGVAAVSVGVFEQRPLLDLNYIEDRDAAVDMNLVMNSQGQFIELQAAGEEATFSDTELANLLTLGRAGIQQLLVLQQEALGL